MKRPKLFVFLAFALLAIGIVLEVMLWITAMLDGQYALTEQNYRMDINGFAIALLISNVVIIGLLVWIVRKNNRPPHNKSLLAIIFTLLSAFQAMGQENVFHAGNLVASDEPGLILAIPAWAVKGDTNLSWIRKEQLLSNGMKTEAIHRLCRTEPLFAALDTIYEIPLDTMEQMVCMPDINHDGKPDILLYAMLPYSDFRPYIFMAINQDSIFQEIFAREGDIVGWTESDNSTQIQILVSGCCEDRHGYLYEYSGIQADSLVHSVFWQGNATHPTAIHAEKPVVIRDTAILLPAPGNSDHQNNIYHQFNWRFFKGDTGEVLYETKADNRKWYYVRMHVKPRNEPNFFVHAAFVYGWISEDELY
ncbi:MAG: hypothetical protein J5792_07555 [Bacteroidales bacterium]|nr:hypothetical protein [Bacteroidales bacterium]